MCGSRDGKIIAGRTDFSVTFLIPKPSPYGLLGSKNMLLCSLLPRGLKARSQQPIVSLRAMNGMLHPTITTMLKQAITLILSQAAISRLQMENGTTITAR